MVTVRLFGEFRAWQDPPVLELPSEGLATVADVKAQVATALARSQDPERVRELVAASALAGSSRIFLETENLADLQGQVLALLPPVSGG